MSAPVFQRDLYSDLYGADMLPVLDELFRSQVETHPSQRETLFKMETTDRDISQYSELHELGLFNQMSEGEEYSFERGKQGSSQTAVVNKYGLGFSISEEAVADGKFDMIADHVIKLARSAKESQEIQAMNILNNGFSSETTADGVSLFNSAHTLPSGGSFRNVLSTAADLSVTSLEQMLEDFETQFVGDGGIIMNIKPKILLVHPSNKRLAKELIGSDLKANTADNNMNSIKEDGLIVISSPHLTDSDAWYLLADPSENGLRIIKRTGIETKAAGPDVGFKTDSILYKSRYREVIVARNGYGVFGTQGA